MRLRAVVLGTVGGVLAGVMLGGMLTPHRPGPPPVPLAEDHGRITRVVLQYQPAAASMVVPIYRQLLAALGREVEVVWVVGQPADLTDLRHRMGTAWPTGHCRGVVVGKTISTWAKDRFVALVAPGGRPASVLCAPARRRTANPLRTHDQEVPYRLARDAGGLFGVRGTEVDFDGGDFLATTRHLFAGPAILAKNAPGAGARFASTAALTRYLNHKMSRRIRWLGETPEGAPPHHLGMFLTVIGQTAAVGDVRVAAALADAHPDIRAAQRAAGGPASPACLSDLRARLDRVARQLQSLGYTVVRVPLLPSATPRAWMSYNNGLVETRNGTTIFYMPTFGAPTLDTAAAHAFRAAMGCTVVPIDCSRLWHLGGSLHCLVNVVGRE